MPEENNIECSHAFLAMSLINLLFSLPRLRLYKVARNMVAKKVKHTQIL